MGVFMSYGTVMLAVQAFESSLVNLVYRIEAREHPAADLRAAVERLTRLTWTWTAGRLKKRLEPHIEDEEFLEELGRAIRWRNRLAHRYLREKAVVGALHDPRTLAELIGLYQSFTRLLDRLAKEETRFPLSERDRSSEPPGLDDVMRNAVTYLLSGGETPLRGAPAEAEPLPPIPEQDDPPDEPA